MKQLTLNISGMSCGHCVGRVTNALNSIAGVETEGVKIGSATVAYDPATTSPAQIAAAVADAGYQAQPAAQAS
jgi:copper chaperone CopZ